MTNFFKQALSLVVLGLFILTNACSNTSSSLDNLPDFNGSVENLSFFTLTPNQAKLDEMDSCNEFNTRMRRYAIARLESHWQDLENYCRAVATIDGFEDPVNVSAVDAEQASDDSSESGSALSYTQQNSQVQGVLEADQVFTNGEYIFVTTPYNEVKIHKAWPVEEIQEVAVIDSSTDFGGFELSSLSRILLSDNQLVVFGYFYKDSEYFTGHVIFDVSDPAQPTASSANLVLSNYYSYWQSGRKKGDRLVSVLNTYLDVNVDWFPDDWSWSEDGSPCNGENVKAEFADLVVEHVAAETDRINTTDYSELLPTLVFADFVQDQEQRAVMSCDQVLINDFTLGRSLIIVSSEELDTNAAPQVQGVLGNAPQMYLNSQSLVLASPVSSYLYNILNEDEIQIGTSAVHRFELTDTGVDYRASGFVPGTAPTQFAIDNDGETTRIATHVFASGAAQPLDVVFTVLEEEDDRLNVAGQITDMVADEEIFSVRYVEDRAYLVTYEVVRNSDPLFVIDTTQNNNPQILGSLDLTGFSSYLQRIDEGVVLGIGQTDTDCWFSGCFGQDYKISLFDVSNEALPTEMSQAVVDVSFADGFIDHLAVHYNTDLQKLFLPLDLGYDASTGFSNYEVSVFSLADNTVTEANRLSVDGSQVGNVLRTLFISDENTDPILFVVGTEGLQTFSEY